ncbi:arsenate reductase/protein-tyrosine-phosphatase family protein [Motilibacter aurantiacus]|uniref:arsenate reductase/protein-tyrosine-phosphatase family protein n=1 Tax=Motilibacter aurantiacus TaxID=2714955 RepID=UPI00140B153B|nr:hypothetical protein [Motilibacter aurantiacus]
MTQGTTEPGEVAGRPALRVLFVCTGNVCRSPAAAALARRLGGDRVELLAESAGTSPLTGHPIEADTAAALHARGIDASAHRGRPITRGLVAAADLVLTMTREQRSQAVALCPPALRRSFTVRELRRLVDRAEAEGSSRPAGDACSAAEWVASVGRWRGLATPGDDDVPDPFGRPAAVHEQVVGLLAENLAVVVPAAVRALAGDARG